MLNMKKVLNIALMFIVFVVFVFIISILGFSVLERYDLLDNSIMKYIVNILSIITGILFIRFLINKMK